MPAGEHGKGMLNARDFGALGDGQTDDTASVQKAMDQASLTHGAVFIPEGRYLCSELKVPEGIGVYGLPAWSYRHGLGTVLVYKGGGKCLINLTGAFGAYMFGLCLDGDNLEGGAHGILVDKPDYGKQEDTPRIDTCRVEKFTGNYIDRSGRCGIALLPGENGRGCETITITGNVIYRSGKPDWGKEDEYDSSHVRFDSVKGLAFVGNALNSGRDDGGKGGYSPDYGIVLKKLESSIVKDNVQHNGALRKLVADLGEHGEGVIIKDNVGSLRKIS
jgi:hypothetical protein